MPNYIPYCIDGIAGYPWGLTLEKMWSSDIIKISLWLTLIMLKVSRVKVRQDKRIFENGKFVGDWLDIKSWGTEKESAFM